MAKLTQPSVIVKLLRLYKTLKRVPCSAHYSTSSIHFKSVLLLLSPIDPPYANLLDFKSFEIVWHRLYMSPGANTSGVHGQQPIYTLRFPISGILPFHLQDVKIDLSELLHYAVRQIWPDIPEADAAFLADGRWVVDVS